MRMNFWLDKIPIWGVFLLSVVIVLLSIWAGTIIGNRRKMKPDHEAPAPLGTVSGATLGLLAFMLAFIFGFTAEIFQTRRQLLLNEVNAIGTTYLRAEMLPQPQQNEIRDLLRQYVDIRADLGKKNFIKSEDKILEAISKSEILQKKLWAGAVEIANIDRNSEIYALFVSSLNEMIDLHTSRVTVLRYRIPSVIWYVLYFITMLSMLAVGYHAGLSGKSSIKMGIILALTFSTVILLIADLDRVTEGHLGVSQRPMIELQEKLMSSTELDTNAHIFQIDKPKIGANK